MERVMGHGGTHELVDGVGRASSLLGESLARGLTNGKQFICRSLCISTWEGVEVGLH